MSWWVVLLLAMWLFTIALVALDAHRMLRKGVREAERSRHDGSATSSHEIARLHEIGTKAHKGVDR